MNAQARRIPPDFPNAPAIGEQFTASSGVIYQWDGTVWIDVVPPYVETDPLSVKLVGDTMTGPLAIPIVPTLDAHATSKGYVDTLAANIVGIAAYCGAADASTPNCNCQFTALSGHPNGPLPPANQFQSGEHLIVAIGGTPTGGEIANVPCAAGDWLISDSVAWYRLPFGGASVLASTVAVTPIVAGGDDVQEVLENLQAQKVAKAGDTLANATLTFTSTAFRDQVSLNGFSATTGGSLLFRDSSARALARIDALASGGVVSGNAEGSLRFSTWNGGWGFQEAFRVSVNSPPLTTFRGPVTIGGQITGNNQFYLTGNAGNAMVMQSDSQKYFDFRRGNNTQRWRIDTNNTADDYLSIRANTNAGTFDQVSYYNRQSWNIWAYGDHSAASHTNRSDIRLKRDIADVGAREAANAFEALKPVRYRLNVKEGYPGDAQTLRWGFVADEVEEGAPSAVSVDDEGMKGYDIAQVLTIAVAKIKELEAQIVELRAAAGFA